jgi:hypothetical protein
VHLTPCHKLGVYIVILNKIYIFKEFDHTVDFTIILSPPPAQQQTATRKQAAYFATDSPADPKWAARQQYYY